MIRLLLPLAILALGSVHAADLPPGPLPETQDNVIGYRTVAEALAALQQRKDVQISTVRGWMIITDSENRTVWSFAPEGYPAHPAVVRRIVRARADGGSDIVTSVLCEATKVACDQMVREFDAMNKMLPHRDAQEFTNTQVVEVNVTADSAPGWLPSAAQKEQVQKAFRNYFSALDARHYDQAYALQTPGQKNLESLEQFRKRETKFNVDAGTVKTRQIVKLTWTKDPANAPAPGVYAALDLTSRFQNIDRHCGYVILYQPDVTAPFLVQREEQNFMTNADAHTIALKQSPQAVDDAWAQLSKRCPNYEPAAVAGGSQ